MNVDMNSLLVALAGAIVPLILRRFKVIPDAGGSPDAADPEAKDFLDWLLHVKSGSVILDSKDKETLKLIKASLADVKVD